MPDTLHFDTLQVHAGTAPDPATGARQVPIYQTTAFQFRDAEHAAKLFNLQEVGFIYSRLTNPTVSALAARIGGEEFAVIAAPDAALLVALAAAIRSALQRTAWDLIHPGLPPVTVSMGLGVAAPGAWPGAFKERVDQALYRAKRLGRNRTEWAVDAQGEERLRSA